ncbi:MAG: L-erythro-3,5-diaminohexanoate dehydrogenase [Deltaproteobacteria bacterium]|nr:L-erythro-3,5-diaminohexanoate dehydrogenase [Deltaproteobacteria bacterium]
MPQRSGGDRFGMHRVFSPRGSLPQAAEKVDPALPLYDNEILIDVETLNIDSASFHQIKAEVGKDPKKIAEKIRGIVERRGKMHNPVTNSGGMLLGTVREVGRKLETGGEGRAPGRAERVSTAGRNPRQDPFPKVGDRIATLVSLTLTPLFLKEIKQVFVEKEQLSVSGHAILFESGVFAKMPADIPEPIALAVLDVCGAPATVPRIVKKGDTVVVLGAGKAGILSLYEAKKKVGKSGFVFCLEKNSESLAQLEDCSFVDEGILVDAQDPVAVYQKVRAITKGKMADVVINTANVPKTEMAAILASHPGGLVYFFNMATNFQAATLGAEGVSHDVRLMMGTGYIPGHAELALNILRESPEVRGWFERRLS